MARRAAVSSAAGSALEWIDFTAYGAVSATVFPVLFFPELDPGSAVLASFATFAVGLFARPLGGVVCGMLGDRFGRRSLLLVTLAGMGIASVLIGLLPTYQQIGLWAGVFLVALRFVQGFALGGEATGGQLMVMEHAPAHRRGLFGSFINMGSPISQVVANAMLFGLAAALTDDQFLAWGWRIPFLSSFLLVALGIYIRLRVAETPAFEAARSQARRPAVPALQVLKDFPDTVLRLLLVWAAPATCFFVITVFTLSYGTETVGMSRDEMFLALVCANLLAVVAMGVGGALSDRIGRRRTLLIGSAVSAVVAIAYFPLINTGIWVLVFVAMAAFVGILQFQTGVQPAFFSEPFPPQVRYSGSAMSYTGANMIFAGPAPFLAAWLQQSSGGQWWVITAYCLVTIGISSVALLRSPETMHVDIASTVGQTSGGVDGGGPDAPRDTTAAPITRSQA